MTRTLTWALRAVALFLLAILALGALAGAKTLGWLSPLGIESEAKDSQVVQAIERTQEVSLVSLGIQGIKQESRSATVLGKSIPGTGEKVFLQYSFTAKLGVDGSKVRVQETGESRYTISVPEFIFIGNAEPKFEVAVEDGGLLSWATADVDKVEMINEILDGEAQQAHIASNEELLKEQTQTFYKTLISSVDPAAQTTFEFRSK